MFKFLRWIMSYAYKFLDGTFDAASLGVRTGLPVFSSPIPGVKDDVILTQDFIWHRDAADSHGPIPLNSPHPTYSSYYLVEEGERKDMGGGFIRSTRVYAKVPATHYDWEPFLYSFVGVTQNIGGGATQTRVRRAWLVKSQVQYDYILCPGTGGVGDPYSFADPIYSFGTYNVHEVGDVKQVLDMQYVAQAGVGGALYGGIQLAVDGLNLETTVLPTWPSAQQYAGMISDALNNGWGSASRAKVVPFPTSTLAGGPPATSGHDIGVIDTTNSVPAGHDSNGNAQYSGTPAGGIIPVEPSRITRWRGNIFQRATRWVLAQ